MLKIRSCKHQSNYVILTKDKWKILVSWEWENSWSMKKQIITEQTIEGVNFLLSEWQDGDITLSVEIGNWKASIPVVIWRPLSSNDNCNSTDVYETLKQALVSNDIKWKISTLI